MIGYLRLSEGRLTRSGLRMSSGRDPSLGLRDVPGKKQNWPPSLLFISTTCLRACNVSIHTKQRRTP